MRTECFVLELLAKQWIRDNEFIKENNINVLLESLNKLDKSISMNFKHIEEALKFVEVHNKTISFYNDIEIRFDRCIIRGNDRGTVIGRFKKKKYEKN